MSSADGGQNRGGWVAGVGSHRRKLAQRGGGVALEVLAQRQRVQVSHHYVRLSASTLSPRKLLEIDIEV